VRGQLGGNLGAPDLSDGEWDVTTMTLASSRKVIARRWGITYIYNEQDDGSWLATKIQGGRVIAEREFGSMPRNIVAVCPSSTRRRVA
jgi:hypothetical protein